jgi:putative hydrolase of the HAD superfamily
LTWLKNKKVPRGILTNGKKSLVQPRIQAAGFSSLVEHTVYGDDFQKPAPEIFRQAMDLLKPAHPSEVLYVGDSFREDIEGAVRCGLKACWIKTDARHPEIRELSRPVLVMPGLSGLLELFQNG